LKPADLQFERSKKKYEAILAKNPLDFAALNDLGLLLWKAGKRPEAFALFLESVQRHPKNATAHANLAFALLRGGAPDQARAEYETALRLDPSHADARRGLAATLAQSGAAPLGAELREIAGEDNAVVTIPYRGAGKPTRVLALFSLGSGNLQLERLLDDRVFATTKLVVELFDPKRPLPGHDVAICGIGDAESCGEALALADGLLRGEPEHSVVNLPKNVMQTTRLENARRLRGLPGVRTPQMRLVVREGLAAPAVLEAEGLVFPLLLRSPGHHTGQHFVLVEHPDDLATAVKELPGDELYAIEYVDVRSDDGMVRKFRVMFVDGKLYPLHLAISPHWKVHYFSADMADNPGHRAEDERFLESMPEVLGSDALAALRRIAQAIGLDYAGIDFALTGSGEILVFETNATMVIVEPSQDERWAYRQKPVQRVIDAFKEMLASRAQRQLAQRP
jgi:hypothetical protein